MNPYYLKSSQHGTWNQYDIQPVQQPVFQPCFFRILYLSDENLEIDCHCDGALLASNLKHSNALNYLQMIPGYHQLVISRNSNENQKVLLMQDVLLTPGEYMTLCVVERSGEVHLYAIIDEVYPLKDKVQKIRMINFTTLGELYGEISQKTVVKNLNAFEMTPYFNIDGNENEVLKISSPTRTSNHLTCEEVDFAISCNHTVYLIDDSDRTGVAVLKLKDGAI